MSATDAVLAMTSIMDLDKPDTFIISSGKKTSIKTIFNEILNLNKIKKNIIILNKKKLVKNEQTLFGDNNKLKIKTKWSIKHNLKDIIKEVLN